MAYERFLDRDKQPTQDLIHKTIGSEVLSVWEDVRDYLEENFPGFTPELIYYNPQEGWGFRWRKEGQQLCVLFPEQGAFTALIPLGPAENELALEKINFFNARIRALLNQPSTLPQGRWLWMQLVDHTDYVGFKLLLDIKKKALSLS
jgi:hypothetical protein